MKKRYAPPAERDRLPAMFVGDEPGPPGALVPATAVEVEASLPDDLRVVTEGTHMERWVFLAPALLLVLIAGMSVAEASPGDGTWHAAAAALCALLGWAGHRYLVKHLKEFRLTGEGIVLEVRHRVGGEPRATRIPWAEMLVYTAVANADEAFLHVVGDRGDTLTLNDVPPRESSREFIRRFVEQAERHGIAARSQTGPPPEEERDPPTSGAGCLAALVGMVVMAELTGRFTFSPAQRSAAFTGLVLAACGLYLWHELTDDDLAYRDRASRKLIARLRRWLRHVLGIRVT